MSIDLSQLGVQCAPIRQWPGQMTKSRSRSPFSAKWSDTLTLLRAELKHLSAKKIVLQVAVSEGQIINDGSRPYADAKPTHPGVILSLESKVGPVLFSCDRFTDWQDNIRAIALGMSDLRRLDRYGITKKGEQYRGWKALPESSPLVAAMTVQQAAGLLVRLFLLHDVTAWWKQPDVLRRAYEVENLTSVYHQVMRHAIKARHPDHGGDTEAFKQLLEAKRVLDAHHGVR